jgi:hypothetical protein
MKISLYIPLNRVLGRSLKVFLLWGNRLFPIAFAPPYNFTNDTFFYRSSPFLTVNLWERNPLVLKEEAITSSSSTFVLPFHPSSTFIGFSQRPINL